MTLITALRKDDAGFIISAELVLVATVAVLGLVVGFSQVQNAVVSELNDVAHAVGSLNQSYYYTGFSARKWGGWLKSRTFGSAFYDGIDACDGWGCAIGCDCAVGECGNGAGGFSSGCGGSEGFSTGGFSSGGSVCGGVASITTGTSIATPIVTPALNDAECLPGTVVPGTVVPGTSVIPSPATPVYVPVQPQLPIPAAPTTDK